MPILNAEITTNTPGAWLSDCVLFLIPTSFSDDHRVQGRMEHDQVGDEVIKGRSLVEGYHKVCWEHVGWPWQYKNCSLQMEYSTAACNDLCLLTAPATREEMRRIYYMAGKSHSEHTMLYRYIQNELHEVKKTSKELTDTLNQLCSSPITPEMGNLMREAAQDVHELQDYINKLAVMVLRMQALRDTLRYKVKESLTQDGLSDLAPHEKPPQADTVDAVHVNENHAPQRTPPPSSETISETADKWIQYFLYTSPQLFAIQDCISRSGLQDVSLLSRARHALVELVRSKYPSQIPRLPALLYALDKALVTRKATYLVTGPR